LVSNIADGNALDKGLESSTLANVLTW
jgi:hypothetical protein